MPLLHVSPQGNSAEMLCANCGSEYLVPKGKWVVGTEGHFTSPPCPECKVCIEGFIWHDAVVESVRLSVIPVTDEEGRVKKVRHPHTGEKRTVTQLAVETYVDPEAFAAEQQVLVGLVAQSLNLTRAKRGDGRKYSKEPERPTKERVKERLLHRVRTEVP